jgi:hypothetical protein
MNRTFVSERIKAKNKNNKVHMERRFDKEFNEVIKMMEMHDPDFVEGENLSKRMAGSIFATMGFMHTSLNEEHREYNLL